MGYIETRDMHRQLLEFAQFNNNMGYIETFFYIFYPDRHIRLITIWDILKQ